MTMLLLQGEIILIKQFSQVYHPKAPLAGKYSKELVSLIDPPHYDGDDSDDDGY